MAATQLQWQSKCNTPKFTPDYAFQHGVRSPKSKSVILTKSSSARTNFPPLMIGVNWASGLQMALKSFSPRVQAVSTRALVCRLCSLVHRCHQQLATSRASATYNLSPGAQRAARKGTNHFHQSLLMVTKPAPHSVCLFLSTKSIVQQTLLS